MKTKVFLSVSIILTSYACSTSSGEEATVQPVQKTLPPPHAAPAVVANDRIQGTVAETMNSGGYTYASIQVGVDQTVWVAGPQTAVKVGDTLDLAKGNEMSNFKSKSLGRTFDTIYFVASLSSGPGAGSSSGPTSQPAATPSVFPPSTRPLGHSSKTGHSSKPQMGGRIQGTVAETMDSRGYTYVGVKTGSGDVVWAAGPQTEVQVGDAIDIGQGSEMKGFTSKSLGRSFDTIYFVSSLGTRSKVGPSSTSRPRSTPGSAPTSAPASAPTKASVPSTPATPISVSKAENGHTIAEVFAQSGELAGTEVTVRGQVVKFNAGIMGTNWLHLEDGTGDAATKTHDLTVTTDATVAVGDVVLIKGLLTKDKNFGAGYRYPVIIEKAAVEKE